MENARDVIDLFTLPDPIRTREIAERLERLNRERQRVEEEILRAILAELEQRTEIMTSTRWCWRVKDGTAASSVSWRNAWRSGIIAPRW